MTIVEWSSFRDIRMEKNINWHQLQQSLKGTIPSAALIMTEAQAFEIAEFVDLTPEKEVGTDIAPSEENTEIIKKTMERPKDATGWLDEAPIFIVDGGIDSKDITETKEQILIRLKAEGK